MYTSNKVIWQDGMFIYPHHFQQQDIYYEDMLNEYHLLHDAYGWGLITLELDYNLLKLNKILIWECKGVFPNGTLFNIPHRDNASHALDIPKTCNNKLIYLGLPIGYLCNVDSSLRKIHARYVASESECLDTSNESATAKNITKGKLNLSLLAEDSENLDQFILVPLFKIATATDGIIIDQTYIPPCLRVNSSNAFRGYINKILGLLNYHLTLKVSLIGEKAEHINQLQNLLILQTVNKFKHLFELLLQDSNLTPNNLFKEVVSLAASITIFSKSHSLDQIEIVYDHANSSKAFNLVIELLVSVFDEINKSTAIELNFEHESGGSYHLKLPDILSLENCEIVIGIAFTNSDLSALSTVLTNSIKVSSIEDIKQIVALHVSGLAVMPLVTIPYYITYDDKTLYFKVNPEGRLWDGIKEDKSIALHIGSEITDVKSIKLWSCQK